MNLMHLKYAVEIARTGSINKAAENLYMGQPNLSRAIKDLETSLGITVFARSPKGMVPTAAGEEFLRYAGRILQEVDEIEHLLKYGDSPRQKFSVSVPRAAYISTAFAEFSKYLDTSLPAEVFCKETGAMQAIKNITDMDYHLGVIRYSLSAEKYFRDVLEEKGLHRETVTEFSYGVIMSKDHPLASHESVTFESLAPYIEISHNDPYAPSLPVSVLKKDEIPENDRKIYVFERALQQELLKKNTKTYMWVSPIPSDLLDKYGFVMKSCHENTKRYKDVLIYKKDRTLTGLDSAFISELYKLKKKYFPPAPAL